MRYKILILALIISGCQKTYWTRSDFTQHQWNQDLAVCEFHAASSVQGVDYSYRTGFGRSLDQEIRKHKLVDLCLKAKGYYITAKNK